MRTCRVGLVGAGGVAQRHARVLGELRGRGAARGDRRGAGRRRRNWPTRTPRAIFADVDELLAAGPDAVYVCVPPFAHGPAEEAVRRGRGADVRGEAGRRRPGDRRADRRPGRRGGGCSPPSVTTGGTCTVVAAGPAAARRPAGAAGQRRVAGQGAPGGLVAACGTAPAARWSSRPPTCWTWPGCLVGEVAEVTAFGDGSPAAGRRRRHRLGDHRHAALRRAARSARSPPPACWAGSTAPAWRSSPTGWPCRWARTALAIRDADGRTAPRRRPGGRPGRRRPGLRRRGPRRSGTTSGCRTRRRCGPSGWRSRSRRRARTGRRHHPAHRPGPR